MRRKRKKGPYLKGMRTLIMHCKGKPSYDKKTAQTAANRRYRQDHIKLRIYHCRNCNHWHLTSKPDWDNGQISIIHEGHEPSDQTTE